MIDEAYPKLWAYLKANEKDFRGRESSRFQKKKPEEWRWYDLARPQSLEAFEQPKVVLQVTARRSNFAFDTKDFFFTAGGTSGVYGLVPSSNLRVEVLAALANSKVGDFYIKHLSSSFGGGYYSYGDQFIKDLPVPLTTEAQQTAIAGLTRTLTEKTATLRSLAAAVRAFPDSVTAARREAGTVPDLETLERLGNLQGLPRVVLATQVSSAHDLMGQVVLSTGKGRMTLKPALAELVLATLRVRGRFPYEALASLNVPEREGEQRAYVEALRGWQEQIVRLRGEIVGLEAELNSKVYEVYGLEEEKGVIEAFLERF